MSFLFGGGRPQPSSAEKIAAAETEIDMVTEMFNRIVRSCTTKCVQNDYREGELNKAEGVCLDRCVSKFFEVTMKVSEKMQSEGAAKAAAGGTGGGMFSM
ncbi:hypothetical protein EJ06DRAFT_508008 [Trichodelitschia bisporula]|uniref:Mitochondrial import inner membrane translocase subunit n=1 Tax=Trichodelitschia bisporula TaxID=703511 RepID=A0A6G1I1G7_9PEZI|nr:hypothetical protein EJ06DRAFT_508008 [Trichodelitschia bisporula]